MKTVFSTLTSLLFCAFCPSSAPAQTSEAQALYEMGKTWDTNYQKDISGLHVDMPKAVEYYQQAAEQNHAPALHELGRIYCYGASYRGIQEDRAKGMSYYQRAADMGYEKSMHALGHLYLGYGQNHVAENVRKGLDYYRQLAQSGDVTAIYSLAEAHFKPESTIYAEKPEGLQDYGKARRCFEDVVRLESENNIAVGHGCTRKSAVYLGIMHRDGLGVPVDYATAAAYFALAAQHGDDDYAIAELGWFYLNGLGVEKNPALARQYLLQVEEQGMAGRAYLAHIYTTGEIVEKNLDRAKMHRSCTLPENETCCFYAECEWDSVTGEWVGN